ncbi:MAG: histidine kinase dimerization/phospho-acceptor domain-containing protein [Croceibacterium sp.]
MALLNAKAGWSVSSLLDFFIPRQMIADTEQHRRARMFMLSHVFGPILGNTLPIYIYAMDIVRDYRVTVFFFSILAFWIYPFLLRWTGRYRLLTFLSIQNLSFCVLWACYSFGGLASPFLSWVLIFPLLSFLYLPPVGWVRNLLLVQIFGSTALLMWICLGPIGLPPIELDKLQVIGMISMASVAIYFAMMSLYFAKMFREQREFSRELNALVSISDNLRNLTSAAEHAGNAKANFIASMSHELRTPLNAIIGYSHLLLEEAAEEGDEQSTKDLTHVHNSGTDLLYLIDHILDYSRIEANRMPVERSYGLLSAKFSQWQASARKSGYLLTIDLNRYLDQPVCTDWGVLGSIIENLVAGLSASGDSSRLHIVARCRDSQMVLQFQSLDAEGVTKPINLRQEMFETDEDISPTKYGSTGIELALAAKFATLLDGQIEDSILGDGSPCTFLRFQIAHHAETLPPIAA